LLGLLFDYEDGGSKYLQNILKLVQDNTVSHPRRQFVCGEIISLYVLIFGGHCPALLLLGKTLMSNTDGVDES
jgi:hypothetical protein